MDRLEEIKNWYEGISKKNWCLNPHELFNHFEWLIEQAEGVSLANRELGKWILECEEKNKRISELEEANKSLVNQHVEQRKQIEALLQKGYPNVQIG